MNKDKTQATIDGLWEDWYVKGLSDFIRVPNLTPLFDADYLTNGRLEQAIECIDKYANSLGIKGMSKKVFKTEEGIPLLLYIIEPSEGVTKNILMYGHLDKQPYGEGWDADKKPTEPTIIEDRLYGRGGADDGYAAFTCLLAVKAAQEQGMKLPRVCLVIEAEEESTSPHLLQLLEMAKDDIQVPDLVFCMDSGAADYSKLWVTSSLRGNCKIDMTVSCGSAGYHSGETGGIVPETFRIVRTLLDRIDDVKTGKVMDAINMEPPAWKVEEAQSIVKAMGSELYDKFPLVDGAKYCNQDDPVQMYLDNSWNCNLAITGADGLPPLAIAGNAVRPSTTVRLGMRLPPSQDPKFACDKIMEVLSENVPYNAKVELKSAGFGPGWCKKDYHAWLDKSLQDASQAFYGVEAGSFGMGGSIPLMNALDKKYPESQLVVLGLIGPGSNPHGPNEMMNLTYAKKLTCCLAHLVGDIAQN